MQFVFRYISRALKASKAKDVNNYIHTKAEIFDNLVPSLNAWFMSSNFRHHARAHSAVNYILSKFFPYFISFASFTVVNAFIYQIPF